MKRLVVLNNPYINKTTTLYIDREKTVVLEKSREGVLEYTQATKDSGKLILKINGIEHFRNSYLFYLYPRVLGIYHCQTKKH